MEKPEVRITNFDLRLAHMDSHQRKLALSFSRGRFEANPFILLVPGGGVEPPRSQGSADFESAASASSAIPALGRFYQRGHTLHEVGARPLAQTSIPLLHEAEIICAEVADVREDGRQLVALHTEPLR